MKIPHFSWRTEAYSSLVSLEWDVPSASSMEGRGGLDTKFEGLEEESTGEYG